MMNDSLLKGYENFKNIQGTKYNKEDDKTKKILQNFREELGRFTDAIFSGFIPLGKGQWQNSGNFSKYLWNRYKPNKNDTNLVIYFNASARNDEGLFISIGLIDDKLNDFEKDKSKEIYKFLQEECAKISCDDFIKFKTDWDNGDRVFKIRDKENYRNLDYSCLLKKLEKVYEDTLNKFYNQSNEDKANKGKKMNTKNIILYGSPGVGKTHNTNKLINLIESGMSEKEIFETIQANEATEYEKIDFKERVKFVTFHQNFGYEDFIEGFRPNEDGKIELVDGVFKALCKEAQKNLDDSLKAKNDIQSGKKFEVLFDLFKDFIQDEIDINQKYNINDTVYITDIRDNAFIYTGANWSYIQRMKFDDIKLLYSKNISERKDIKKVDGTSGLSKHHATYFSYFMKQLFEFESKQEIQIKNIEKVERKNYYLIIDEINRGNISKIFGEIITLIEEDKRDKLEVTLPYSKLPFKIPSNLYIIGTMNSTDKSIALIDIALRRRFTFLKMKPSAELITHLKAKEIFSELNNKIIEKLGEDYQIGHSYFMDIEDEEDLKFVLDHKIEPLLEEYFYGDDSGLKEILRLIENSSDEEEEE